MPKAKKTTPRRYRGGKTLDVSPGEGSLGLEEAKALLGIKTRETFLKHRKSLGIAPQKRLTWDDMRDILGMKLWLLCDLGNHSREQYLVLREHNVERAALLRFGIDLEAKLEELKEHHGCTRKLSA